MDLNSEQNDSLFPIEKKYDSQDRHTKIIIIHYLSTY